MPYRSVPASLPVRSGERVHHRRSIVERKSNSLMRLRQRLFRGTTAVRYLRIRGSWGLFSSPIATSEIGLRSNSLRDHSMRKCNRIVSCKKLAKMSEFQEFQARVISPTYDSIDKTGQVLLRRGVSSRH